MAAKASSSNEKVRKSASILEIRNARRSSKIGAPLPKRTR